MAKSNFDFSNDPVNEEPVKIRDKDGTVRQYVLREASGGAATRYRNAALSCHLYNDEGRLVGFKDLASVEPLLVSLCIFEVTDKGEVPVLKAVVESWPNHVQKQLFERALEMSDIKETLPQERAGIQLALEQPGAPVDMKTLQGYFQDLPDCDEYRAVKKWLEPTAEELAKNALSGTTAGSDSPTS